jgi:hypothetical protein
VQQRGGREAPRLVEVHLRERALRALQCGLRQAQLAEPVGLLLGGEGGAHREERGDDGEHRQPSAGHGRPVA